MAASSRRPVETQQLSIDSRNVVPRRPASPASTDTPIPNVAMSLAELSAVRCGSAVAATLAMSSEWTTMSGVEVCQTSSCFDRPSLCQTYGASSPAQAQIPRCFHHYKHSSSFSPGSGIVAEAGASLRKGVVFGVDGRYIEATPRRPCSLRAASSHEIAWRELPGIEIVYRTAGAVPPDPLLHTYTYVPS